MPIIEIGGIGKNFIIISNFLSQKLKNVTVITTTNDFRINFLKNWVMSLKI